MKSIVEVCSIDRNNNTCAGNDANMTIIQFLGPTTKFDLPCRSILNLLSLSDICLFMPELESRIYVNNSRSDRESVQIK